MKVFKEEPRPAVSALTTLILCLWWNEVMVKSRRIAREIAAQALYGIDLRDDWSEEAIEDFFGYFFTDAALLTEEGVHLKELRDKPNRDFSRQLVTGVLKHQAELDQLISVAASHWNIERMLFVDRNILRLAVYEILFIDEVPINVTINEAIEVAKRLGTDESPTFVNGVLDGVARYMKEEPQRILQLFPSYRIPLAENG